MENILNNDIKITGTQINYLLVCRRKLWFFLHGITMEQESDRVAVGREVHENTLNSKKSELLIDNSIRLDYIDKELAVHEIKLSKAMNEASRYQLLYYIFYLKNKGVNCSKGVIHYPDLRKTETIELKAEDENRLKTCMDEIIKIGSLSKPPEEPREKKCKSCSYYEICFC